MSNKTLLLHHFEPYWNDQLLKFNTNFENEVSKVIDYLYTEENIDHIIITTFESPDLSEEHQRLINHCLSHGITYEISEHGYGFERLPENENEYPLEKQNIDWCFGNRLDYEDHNIVPILPFHHKIKQNNDKVFLAGAFDNECIQDAEDALSALNINYERVNSLIVGHPEEYVFSISEQEFKDEYFSTIQYYANEINEFIEDNDIFDIEELKVSNPEFLLEQLNELYEFLEEIDQTEFPHIDFETWINDVVFNNELVEDVVLHWLEYQEKNEEIFDEIEFNIKRKMFDMLNTSIENNEFYHGTFWRFSDNELETHTELLLEQTSCGANFISNEESVAEYFSSWTQGTGEDGAFIVFKLNLELNSVFSWNDSLDRIIELYDMEYDIVENREDMYKNLHPVYDAIVIENNYPSHNGGDDIAYLKDISENDIVEAKIKFDDDWSDYMPVAQLLALAEKHYKNKNKKSKKVVSSPSL